MKKVYGTFQLGTTTIESFSLFIGEFNYTSDTFLTYHLLNILRLAKISLTHNPLMLAHCSRNQDKEISQQVKS